MSKQEVTGLFTDSKDCPRCHEKDRLGVMRLSYTNVLAGGDYNLEYHRCTNSKCGWIGSKRVNKTRNAAPTTKGE